MKAPLDWMQEFVAVPDDVREVASKLALCGFEVAGIEGAVIDFEITANRPDCLSVYGLAREASAAFNLDLTRPAEFDAAPDTEVDRPSPVRVSIGDAGCGRYALGVFEVRVAASPAWLQNRLTAAGVRPINNIVDVTNYVMLEFGHPMHAFDAARLAGHEIRVRRARPGEPLTTLDGQTRTLDETMLVIADREKAVAVAGVMGGADTEVSDATFRIALESAWFQPGTVRSTSRRLGLKTEASARFERGADWAAPVAAIRRAKALFDQISAGTLVGRIIDVHPRIPDPVHVSLRRARLAVLLGADVPDVEVVRILTRLGFAATASGEGWDVQVPSFRVDVTREADLIEEVGRHWGFERIAPTFPPLKIVQRPSPAVDRDRRLRRVLTGAGLQDAVTFTFIERAAAEPFVNPADAVVEIANPLSEKFAVLRPSLLPGLLDAVIYSRRREHEDVRLFEVGAAFTPKGEQRRVGWLLTGARSRHWSAPPQPVDFFDAAGVGELIGDAFGVPISAATSEAEPWFVRGRSARLVAHSGDSTVDVGWVGELRQEVAGARGLPHGGLVVGGELLLDPLIAAASSLSATVSPPSRYPSIVRDLAIIVSDRLPAAEVRGTIRRHAPEILASIREFDRYQGPGVPEDRVSLAVRLTFRASDRTLTDLEVQHAVDAIVAALERAHGAVLRGGERQK